MEKILRYGFIVAKQKNIFLAPQEQKGHIMARTSTRNEQALVNRVNELSAQLASLQAMLEALNKTPKASQSKTEKKASKPAVTREQALSKSSGLSKDERSAVWHSNWEPAYEREWKAYTEYCSKNNIKRTSELNKRVYANMKHDFWTGKKHVCKFNASQLQA